MVDNGVRVARTAEGWFVEARRGYSEEHQACPCCRARHCVFRARWGSRTEYHCIECDFSTAHDDRTGAYSATLGASTRHPPLVLMGIWQGDE